jgi:hypothetical protein
VRAARALSTQRRKGAEFRHGRGLLRQNDKYSLRHVLRVFRIARVTQRDGINQIDVCLIICADAKSGQSILKNFSSYSISAPRL